MLVYDESLEEALTDALQLSYRLQEVGGINKNQLLERQLEYLSMYANYDNIDNCIVILYPDFSPFSFAVSWFFKGEYTYSLLTLDNLQTLINKPNRGLSVSGVLESYGYKFRMNGGLIYHGAHDGGGDGGAPTFSVNLSPVNGWSIHT